MNPRRAWTTCERGWGLLTRGTTGGRPGAPPTSRLRFSDAPSPPTTTVPHLPISDCACSHQPAGDRALRAPGAPIRALQIPRNVKLGGSWREGRSWEGASHTFGNLKLPSPQRPCWYPDPHLPRGLSVPRWFASLYLYLCPARSPTFPWLQKPGRFCPGHPKLSPTPHPPIPSGVSQPPTTFCVIVHGFTVMEKVETSAVPKASPQRTGQKGRTGKWQEGEGEQERNRL